MLGRSALHLVLFANLIAATPALAAKAPLGPDELDKQSDAVVVGKVQSYRMASRVMEGEERTQVTLDVELESVEKGKPGESGKVIQIECDRLTRMSPFGLPTHNGNETIPAIGSRAKFYLAGRSALAPNGIELLDGGAELLLPMKSPWTAFLERPLVLAPVVLVLLIVLLMFALSKKRKAAVA